MLNIGRFNTLTITKTLATGAVLDGGKFGSVLLTRHSDKEQFNVGEQVSAFVYLDSEGELAATTKAPAAQVGEVAYLLVKDCNNIGGFLEWGLTKDLFVPFSEQTFELKKGQTVLVKLYLDNQNRIAASTRLDHLLSDDVEGLAYGDSVSLIVGDKTTLGYKAVINHRFWGLLYDNELYQPIKKGQKLTGYIKKVRGDNKVDLSLVKPGYSKNKIESVCDDILEKLNQHDGQLLLNDKSPPEAIHSVFGVSKKIFKQAVGSLYKQRLIIIEAKGIKLNK